MARGGGEGLGEEGGVGEGVVEVVLDGEEGGGVVVVGEVKRVGGGIGVGIGDGGREGFLDGSFVILRGGTGATLGKRGCGNLVILRKRTGGALGKGGCGLGVRVWMVRGQGIVRLLKPGSARPSLGAHRHEERRGLSTLPFYPSWL